MGLRIILLGMFLLPGAVASAESTAKGELSTDDATLAMQREGESTSLVSVDHELSLRLRPELLIGGDLNSSASPIRRALGADADDASLLSWASMRVRYGATIHLGQRFRIQFSADALDNLVLGSNPASGHAGFNEGTFSDGQGSPTSGINGLEDALLVREVYGSWHFLSLADLDFGRMNDHFGSGLIRNRGDCIDCDRGSYFDGIRAGLDLFGVRAEATIELTDVGAVETGDGWTGQPKDFGVDDDTLTYTVRVLSSRTPSMSDRQRSTTSREVGSLQVDWGIFFAFTEQVLSSEKQSVGLLPTQCTTESGELLPRDELPWDCWQLQPRQLFIWKPSLWTKIDWRPDFSSRLTFEIELAGQFGDAQYLQGDPDLGDTSKDFEGFAGALDLTYRTGRLETGLSAGFATGDDRLYLGYLDGQNIVDPDDANYEANENVRTNANVTSYWFNTDYKLDLLLFRQILGGVTNAYYVKPWVSYALLDTDDLKIKARFDVAYAGAMNPEGTPGQGNHWGIEMDAGLHLEFSPGFEVAVDGGVLLPMDALADPTTGADPSTAFALRGLFIWRL